MLARAWHHWQSRKNAHQVNQPPRHLPRYPRRLRRHPQQRHPPWDQPPHRRRSLSCDDPTMQRRREEGGAQARSSCESHLGCRQGMHHGWPSYRRRTATSKHHHSHGEPGDALAANVHRDRVGALGGADPTVVGRRTGIGGAPCMSGKGRVWEGVRRRRWGWEVRGGRLARWLQQRATVTPVVCHMFLVTVALWAVQGVNTELLVGREQRGQVRGEGSGSARGTVARQVQERLGPVALQCVSSYLTRAHMPRKCARISVQC